MEHNISVQYSETASKITVTVFKKHKIVAKVITCKATGQTVTKVYKEEVKKPIEEYVYDKVL